VVNNAAMPLRRIETSLGPLAFGGRTITLVARTTAIRVGNDQRAAMLVRSRPMQVEVLDEDGRRHVIHIRDLEYVLVAGITLAAIVGTWAARAINTRRPSP